MHLASVYVPNSGDKLARLGYRVGTWDPSLRRYLGQLDAQKPVVVLGDFNVCHLDADFYNPEDPRTKKQSATTPEERSSFSELLDAGFIDTFRWKHPEASGAYSYWSQRARNRPYNRGLRIDYALVSQRLENRIIDAFILHEETEGRNDHCPVALVLKQDQSPW
uniref:Endonuclease/exonuclease/phosphatase domain-containing protein n=1 Tax=Heterosigma akashiwo TaxID=2829 RepID=A0A7S4D5F5_HETAK